ncbi:MAG: hypothetical protein KJ799_15325 [Bacteroidetes bacterium]|nr:hypothetical protein [Bacteroidota bacterium]
MMTKIKILALFILCSVASFGQHGLEKQLSYAQNLFESELYFEAVTEFKRLDFFDKYKIHDYEIKIRIGQSYKMGGYYDEAIKYFALAVHSSRNGDERFNAKLELVRTNILRRTHVNALNVLDELQGDREFKERNVEISYWRGWTYMLSDKWANAAKSFAEVDSNHALKILSEDVEKEKYSVTFAKLISYILPGAGQVYTGNYLSGAMSFGWHLLWGGLTINAFAEDRILDGLLIADLLWLRFYVGSNQNTEHFVIEKNKEIANKAFEYLQNRYEGKKP